MFDRCLFIYGTTQKFHLNRSLAFILTVFTDVLVLLFEYYINFVL